MDYKKQEFIDLMERAEEQGCVHRDEVHGPRTYWFTGPHYNEEELPGCGNSTLFDIPYFQGPDEPPRIIEKVCAVDDDMGRWPRFGGDRFGKD